MFDNEIARLVIRSSGEGAIREKGPCRRMARTRRSCRLGGASGLQSRAAVPMGVAAKEPVLAAKGAEAACPGLGTDHLCIVGFRDFLRHSASARRR